MDDSGVAHRFSIDLHHVSAIDSLGGYHQGSTSHDTQRQHAHIMFMESHAKELSLQGELMSIVHGKYDTKNGDSSPATLCIFQFLFSGSQIYGRRFRKAIITVSFGYQTALGTLMDPEVANISPDGDFFLDHVIEECDAVRSINLNIGLGSLLGMNALDGGWAENVRLGANVRVGWKRRAPSQKEGRITLAGLRKTLHRNFGSRNTVMWVLKENYLREAGVPPLFRGAVLLKPKDGENFQAVVTVDVDVDAAFNVSTKVKRLLGKTQVDPIVFSQIGGATGAEIEGLDPDNLKEAIDNAGL